MAQLYKFLLVALLGFAPCRAEALSLECVGKATTPSADFIAKIEKRFQSITSISATFEQESIFLGLDKRELSSGAVSFEKPGKMDWRYSEPVKQRFVADGTSVWFYQPSSNQVTITELKSSFTSNLPVTFLFGLGKISDSFVAKNLCKSKEGMLLELQPKVTDANLANFFLVIRESDVSPLGARVLDVGGNETTIVLRDVRFNAALSADTFRFDVPKGVDVIDERNAVAAPASVSEENLSGGKS